MGEEIDVREPLSEEERQRCLRKLMMLHRNTGHGPRAHLVRALEARGTDPRIVDLARNLECSACQEAKRHVPRPHATLDPLPPKWNRVQGDNAHWQHPHTGEKIQFTVLVDEGCRFRVGRVMSKTSKGVSGNMLIQFFQEQWKPIFGVPDKIRLDPAGPWRSENVVSYFESIGVEVDNIPAEAHWQISIVERTIQGVKHVMTKLARSEPEITPEEALSEALRVGNEKETVRGYSPAQHALGRAPDENGKFHVSTLQAPPPVLCENGTGEFQRNMERMKIAEQSFTEHVYNERLKRAQNSRSFGIRTFAPGDLVYVWRMQTKSPGMSFRTGGYTGPARVLATETRVGDDGNYSPGSVVWVIRGNRLLKTCPLQLRHASVRETCMEEIEQPPELPWTLTKLTEGLSARQYEDVSQKIPDEMEMETGMDEETVRPMKRCRFKQRDDHGVPVQPQEVLGNPGEAMDDEDPELLREDPELFGECSAVFESSYAECFWTSEGPAVELSFETPTSIRGKKYMSENLLSFMVGQLKRRAVEVSEKHMDAKELAEIAAAKQVEVKKFIAAEALQVLPQHLQPDKNTAMRMRWVLTWKKSDSGERSAKARCVILGYLDPNYAFRQTAAPTMSRTTRQLLLGISAGLKFQVEKGDVTGAFLQGREYQGTAYVVPTDEICGAMGITSGSVTKLRKACYGLVDAPLEWFLTVSDYLTSIGFVRCVTDPCAFKFVENDRLVGIVSGHVDDFLFCGPPSCVFWKNICEKIREHFKWGTWEKGSFTQCGVHIKSLPCGGFELSQEQYIEDMKEIPISAERRKQMEAETTEREKTRLRAALGMLSWCAQQTCPHLSAAVGLLLSQVTCSVVRNLVEVNKLIYQTRSDKHHKLVIHGGLDLRRALIVCWADASSQNRVDGKSTQWMFVGLTDQALLDGAMCKVTPIAWHSAKISRQCRSPGAAESLAAIDCEDLLYAVRLQFFELTGGTVLVRQTGKQVKTVNAVLVTDSTNVYDRLQNTVYVPKGPERRTALEMIGLKEAIVETNLNLRWVNSDAQLGNPLTKEGENHQLRRFYQLGGQWKIVDDPQMMSAKRRKKLGLEALEDYGDLEPFRGHVNSWSVRTHLPSGASLPFSILDRKKRVCDP